MSDTILENVSVPVTDEDNQDQVDDENLLSVLDSNTSTSSPINFKTSSSTPMKPKLPTVGPSSNAWKAFNIIVAILGSVIGLVFLVVILPMFWSKIKTSTQPKPRTGSR